MTRSLNFYAPSKKRQRPEARLQKALVQILRLQCNPNVLWFSTFNERKGVRAMADMKARGLRAGVADMVFIIEGRAHFLELKSNIGRQSEAQLEFMTDSDRAGSVYALTNSLDEAIEILSDWGVFRGALKGAKVAA